MRTPRITRERLAEMDAAGHLAASSAAGPMSTAMVFTDTIASTPLNSNGATVLGTTTRTVHVARGLSLAHSGTAREAFAVTWRDALVRHKPGDAVHADAETRGFFDRNSLPIEWSDS